MKAILKIREDRKDEFVTFISRLNKKAAKLALHRIETTWMEPEVIDDKAKDPRGLQGLKLVLLPVLVEGEEPMLHGWRFVAAIDHMIEGEEPINVVRCHPDRTLDPKWRAVASNCEHCSTKRNRLKTYVLEHEDGRQIQVGSTCIGDFLGVSGMSPENAAQFEEELYVLFSTSWSDEGGGGGGGLSLFDTDRVLEVAAAQIRLSGWISRKKAMESVDGSLIPTASKVTSWLCFDHRRASEEERFYWNEARPTEADREKAKCAREWAKGLTDAKNDYEYNLFAIASLNCIAWKHIGIAASMISAYERATGEALKRKERAIASKHFGKVKEKAKLTAKITRIGSCNGYYGLTWIIGFVTEEGNEAVWFASHRPEAEIGDQVTVVGTIKDHSEYKGVKQTTLTRCKLTKI